MTVPVDGAQLASLEAVPNGAAVANDAVSGTSANVAPASLAASPANPSSDGANYLLPTALIGGVVVAVGAITVVCGRNAS